jgi:membrane associated rhomboid family serine protease
MIPLYDDNPTLRTPIVTYLLLAAIAAMWILVQGAGLDPHALSSSVCNLGLVPGEITGLAKVGTSIALGQGMACVIDNDVINLLTPVSSMFLHGGFGHLLGNGLFLWVFGNNVEDSMGRVRFGLFYVLCGLAAAIAQVAFDPSSPVPMVGASGAISGVMGAYLVLYPRVRVSMLFIIVFFIRVVPLPAWVVLVWWFVVQVLMAMPALDAVAGAPQGGVAVFAHVGGFVAGIALVKLFENRALHEARVHAPRRVHRYRR